MGLSPTLVLHSQAGPLRAGFRIPAALTLQWARGTKKALSSLHCTVFRPAPAQHLTPSPAQQSPLLASQRFCTYCPSQPLTVFQDGRPITTNWFRKSTRSQDLISHQPSSCNKFQQLGFEMNQWPALKWKAPKTIITPQSQPPALPLPSLCQSTEKWAFLMWSCQSLSLVLVLRPFCRVPFHHILRDVLPCESFCCSLTVLKTVFF